MHPLALLSAPFFGLWWMVFRSSGWWLRIRRAAVFCAGLGGGLILWHCANIGHATQGRFLRYFFEADTIFPSTPATWCLSRWNNFANTMVPFYVWTANSRHSSFDAIGTVSSPLVHFFLQ